MKINFNSNLPTVSNLMGGYYSGYGVGSVKFGNYEYFFDGTTEVVKKDKIVIYPHPSSPFYETLGCRKFEFTL